MSDLVSYATSAEADFENMQWIFVMEPECRVFTGRCAIMPADDLARLTAQRDELRKVCAEAYQMAGALGAPVAALDNLSAAANGDPLPHETFLPVETPDLVAENDRLRDALVQKVADATLLTSMKAEKGIASFRFEGGACGMFAEAFGEQFTESGATNYVEAQFMSERVGPLIVTMQRVTGKTPHQLRVEAEAQRDELLAVAKTCAIRFRMYEAHHLAKRDPEKAVSNSDMAVMCEAAIASATKEQA